MPCGLTLPSTLTPPQLGCQANLCVRCSHLKSPRLPIWVVCAESHFTILFAADQQNALIALEDESGAEKPFDLLYYDELANQQQVYLLTIVPHRVTSAVTAKRIQNDNTAPLEHVIRTKWSGAEIGWNGSEPLL